MSLLTILFSIKIIVTLLMVALPFLFLSKVKLEGLTATQVQSTSLFRLYGVAVLALLFGYGGGIWLAVSGQFPWGPVIMGIVSNAGATLVLIKTGTASKSRALTVFFGIIGLCLVLAVLFPETAMRAVF